MLIKRPSAALMKQDMRGHDFSGTDLVDVKARDYNFFEAIFGGCNLRRWRVSESIFQHTDFAESRIEDCRFEQSSFDHSDFVGSEIRNCLFRRCSFQNAEWRDVTFVNVQFQQCIFRNTTASLARFVDCSFDRSSSSSFVGSSKRHNTLARSSFHLEPDQLDFLKTNFGIQRAGDETELDPDLIQDPLFSASADYFHGVPFVGRPLRKIVAAIETMAAASPPQSLFRLKYALDICRLLIEVDEISILAIQYIHDRIQESFSQIHDSSVVLELVAFLALLRLKLREKIAAANERLAGQDAPAVGRLRCQFHFEATYPREAARDFATSFAMFCGQDADAMQILDFQGGSTIFDILTELATPITQALRWIAYYLPKATVVVKETAKLTDASTALVKSARKRTPQTSGKTARAKRKPSRKSAAAPAAPLGSTALTVQPTEVFAPATGDAKEIQVIVRVAAERVVAMGGQVEVRVLVHQ